MTFSHPSRWSPIPQSDPGHSPLFAARGWGLDSQPETESQDQPVRASGDLSHLQTQRERAERFGLYFERISVLSSAPAPQVQTQPQQTEEPDTETADSDSQLISASAVGSPEAHPEPKPDTDSSPPEFSSASGSASPSDSNDSSEAHSSDPVLSLQAQRERAEQFGHHFSKVSVLSPSADSGSPAQTSPDLETTIQSARGGGEALAPDVQTSMGQAFGGINFSGVQIHTDAQADTLNRSISARAFTTGQDVFFRAGEFSPGSRSGQELLAHELTHVVQQSGGQLSTQAKLSMGQPGDPYEREADSMAAQVVQRLSSPPLQREQIQRQLAAHLNPQPPIQRQPLSPVMQWRMVQAHFGLSSPPQIQPLCSECAQEQEEQLHLQRLPALSFNLQAPDLQANIFSDAWDGATDLAGDAWDATTGAASDAADWVGDRAEDVMEMGADAFAALVARVSPELAELIRNGPEGMIGEQLQSGLQSWLQSLLGGVDLGSVVSQLQSGLSEVVGSLQGALSGEGSSCEAFTQGIDKLRDLAQAFMDNPAFQAIQSAFQQVGSAFEQISQMVLAPAFDALMEVGGGVLDGVMNLATQIWEWGAPVRDALGDAWDWVLEQLGVSGDGEGGIVNWLKEQAGEVWSGLKDTFGPVVEPLQQIVPVLAAFSPVGPFIAMAQYSPELIESVGWLWENRGNPEIVKSAHEEMGHTILPRLLENAQGLSQGLSQGVSTVVEQATQLSESFLQVLGSISGIPILSAAQSVIQSATDGLQGLVTFAQEQLSSAAENVTQLVGSLKTKLEPYAGLLTQIGLAVVNPSLIPVMLAGQAWVMLPDCYKGPLIDLLLDGVIGLVQAAGSLPGFGPLWGMLQSGILGFLQGVRNQDTESKVKITNKLATILSGGSPDFIIGFVKGLGKGLWEGLTDPFKLAYEAVKGLGNLVSWLVSVANQAMSPQKETALEPVAAETTPGGEVQPGSGGPPPELGQRMSEMASELQPPVEQVSQGFMPALQEAFSGGEGLTYEGLMQKLGEASAAVESAIQGAGEQLAQKVCEFLMQDSAEGSMGESVGWLAGTIAFEVVLGILTAGSWTAASGAMKVLKGFARILDWTGEALGAAFKALSRVGGFLLEAIQGLGRLVGNMGGAVRGILDALQEIGEKLIRFGEELLGLAGRKASGEAAEEIAEEATEQGAKRSTTEATQEVGERTTQETAEDGAEQSGRKTNDSPDMNEKLRVAAEAAVVSNSLESSGMPARAIASTLEKTFHPRYGWIRGFEVEEKGVRSVIFMIASKIFVDEVERPENYSDLTPEEQDHILGGEFSAESIHKSGGHGYPANIDRLKANGYSEITREEFERRLAQEKPFDDALRTWQNASRKTRGRRPQRENFGLAPEHITMREQKVFYFEPSDGGTFRGGVFPAKNPIHVDGKTWLPDGWGQTEVEAATRHLLNTVTPKIDERTSMKIYTAFVKIEGGVLETSESAAEGFFKVTLLDNGSKRTLFPQMHQ